jgi:hypothetical protein
LTTGTDIDIQNKSGKYSAKCMRHTKFTLF